MPAAVVVPQRATFEILDKRYVYVVDKDDIAHQREIAVRAEVDDLFVIKEGLVAGEKIVVEGIRTIHDGEKATAAMDRPQPRFARQHDRPTLNLFDTRSNHG